MQPLPQPFALILGNNVVIKTSIRQAFDKKILFATTFHADPVEYENNIIPHQYINLGHDGTLTLRDALNRMAPPPDYLPLTQALREALDACNTATDMLGTEGAATYSEMVHLITVLGDAYRPHKKAPQ